MYKNCIEVTFQDVLDSHCGFDASGIDNPNEWLWCKSGTNNIFYPSSKK